MKHFTILRSFAVLMAIGFSSLYMNAQNGICSAATINIGAIETGDNTGATPDGPIGSCWGDGPAAVENDIWFTFTAPASGGVTVETIFTGGNDDTQIAVYSSDDNSCTGTLTEVGCNDDIDLSTQNYMSLAQVCDLVPNDIYFIQVDGWQGTAGEFDITVVDNPDCVVCDPTGCDAGEFGDDTLQEVCPEETASFQVIGFTLPPDPVCDASGAILVAPVDASASGGPFDGEAFNWTNPDLSGAVQELSSSDFTGAPLLGLWELIPFVRINGGTEVCDASSRSLEILFLDASDAGCAPPLPCVAGEVLAGDQVLCPGQPIDLTLSAEHSLPFGHEFEWYFENLADETDFRYYTFGSNPDFYQFVGDLQDLLGPDSLAAGTWLVQGDVFDLAGDSICDFTPVYFLDILDAADPLCTGGGTDCSAFQSAPVDLTKSFDPVNGVRDRVQVKWFKESGEVRYTVEDNAACDIEYWAYRFRDDEFSPWVNIPPAERDTSRLPYTTVKKTNNRPLFKWPLKFRLNNGTNQVLPNRGYRWRVRCYCDQGALVGGQQVITPWSEERFFNTPDFDPETGIYDPPGGIIADEFEETAKSRVLALDSKRIGEAKLIRAKKSDSSQKRFERVIERNSASSKSLVSGSDIGLYPNPTNNMINVTMDDDFTNVNIMDMAGRMVLQQGANSNIARVDVSSLKAGMYMVEVEVDGMISRKPFVKK